VTVRHTIQHSVVSAAVRKNASEIRQQSKCDRGVPDLHFSNAADGWWQENMLGSLVIVGHLWNPLCSNLSFPQAVSDDAVNTFWNGSDFSSNCRTWENASTVKGRCQLLHVALFVSDIGAALRVHSLCLSGHPYWPSSIGEEFKMKEHVYVKLLSNLKGKNQLEDRGVFGKLVLNE